jgi:hypothetical protein
MQHRSGGISPGQDESAQWRQIGLESIDPVFEALNVRIRDGDLRHALGDFFRRIGEPRSDRKQIFLQLLEQPGNIAGQRLLGANNPEAGIQLVNFSVRGNARIRFRYAGASEQRRTPRIARARVNLHGRQYT